jgi:hypothetical protein
MSYKSFAPLWSRVIVSIIFGLGLIHGTLVWKMFDQSPTTFKSNQFNTPWEDSSDEEEHVRKRGYPNKKVNDERK